jgi:hypothetical protein
MKKTLLPFALALALAGCSADKKDADPTPTPPTQPATGLTGTWNIVKIHEVEMIDTDTLVNSTTTLGNITAKITDTKYQVYVGGMLSEEQAIERRGDTLFVLPRPSTVPYSLITKLTATELELKSDDVDVSGAGTFRTTTTTSYTR